MASSQLQLAGKRPHQADESPWPAKRPSLQQPASSGAPASAQSLLGPLVPDKHYMPPCLLARARDGQGREQWHWVRG